MIRLKVPCTLRYRELALRVVAEACKLVLPRRASDPREAYGDFDDQVVTSFGEAFTNVVQHGGVGPDGPPVEIEIEPHPDRLTIRLLDHGKPFDLGAVPAPDLGQMPESGMGVYIMKSWMTDVSYAPGETPTRNVLSMTKRLGDFSRTDDGVATTLRIGGVLDAMSTQNVRPTIDAIVADHRRAVTVDLSELKLVDSSGVGVIVSLYKRCKAFGGTVRVEGLTGQPLAIFKLLKLDRVFDLS